MVRAAPDRSVCNSAGVKFRKTCQVWAQDKKMNRRSAIALVLLLLLALGGAHPARAQTSTIFGMVTALDGVTPIEGAEVRLFAQGSPTPLAIDVTLIDGTFAFATTTLAPGQYIAIAYPGSSGAGSASEASAFQVVDNITDVDLGVIKLSPAQVSGVLLSPSGTRISSNTVSLRSTDGKKKLWDVTTPGHPFSFGDLPPGNYVLQVYIQTEEFWIPPAPVAVRVTAGGAPQSFRLSVRAPDAAGVVGLNGAPVAGIELSALTAGGVFAQGAKTDKAGRFFFVGLVKGASYYVDVYPTMPNVRQGPPLKFTLVEIGRLQNIGTVQLFTYVPLLTGSVSRP